MGSGSWDATSYRDTRNTNAAKGVDDFAYTASMATTPRGDWKVSDRLDPKNTNRESRDSDEHPTSLAITIAFDVTGSMGGVPRLLLEKLPRVYGLLMTKGYVEHPQVMFAAIGDAYSDRAPLQVGQWESDNRADEDLLQIFLEKGGGGTRQESYELFAYYMARHTSIDCWEKRGHRGYCFIIGDEMAYPRVDPEKVQNVIGEATEPVSAEQIFADLRERFDVYYLLPQGTTYFGSSQESAHVEHWRQLVGPQNVILVPDTANVAEIIAGLVGVAEDAVDLDDLAADLREIGASDADVKNVSTALAHVGGGGTLATSDGPADLDSGDGGATRL